MLARSVCVKTFPMAGAVTVPGPLVKLLVPLAGMSFGPRYLPPGTEEKPRSLTQLYFDYRDAHSLKFMLYSFSWSSTIVRPTRSWFVVGHVP